MATPRTVVDAAGYTLPASSLSTAIATNAAATIDLTEHVGQFVSFAGSAGYRLRASADGAAATAGDLPWPSGTVHRVKVTLPKLSVRGTGAGLFYWAVTS